MTPTPDPPEPVEPVLCTACAAKGRKVYLKRPVSRALRMGDKCATRALRADPDAARNLGLQLAFDLGEVQVVPRPRRRAAVPV